MLTCGTTDEESSLTHDHEHFPDPESAIQVTIKADQQPLETDEDVLHRYHEQFDRLMSLLLTDIGDDSLSSLRRTVLDWESDNNRKLLTVTTGVCQWVLEKTTTDPLESCNSCTESGKRCGFVRDAQLEVITVEEANVIAQYLSIAIKQSRQESGISDEQARALEAIRDSTRPRPPVPPSIRDDVSVSVRNDKPHLEHEVARIRQRDAQVKAHAEKQRSVEEQPHAMSPKLLRRKTGEMELQAKKTKAANHQQDKQHNNGSAQTVQPADVRSPMIGLSGTATPATTARTRIVPVVDPVSVLFLGSSHLRKSPTPR